MGEALHRGRQRGAEHQPGEHGHQGRIWRLAALRQQGRAEPAPDRRPDHEAGQRKAAGDQATLVADHCKREREDRDDHVDEVHVSLFDAAPGTNFVSA